MKRKQYHLFSNIKTVGKNINWEEGKGTKICGRKLRFEKKGGISNYKEPVAPEKKTVIKDRKYQQQD